MAPISVVGINSRQDLKVALLIPMLRQSVSVDHASSCVALKGPWRQACARVGGREGEGLSGCDPDASVTKRGVHDEGRARGGHQPSTPINFWGAGKDLLGRRACGDADTGTRSRNENRFAGGRFGARFLAGLRIARRFLAAVACIGFLQTEVDVSYLKSGSGAVVMHVSVDHASSCVALMGPWRHARARVGGREG